MSGESTTKEIGGGNVTAFLSYAREDQALAERLAAALAKSGVQVWWDKLIEGGTEFAGSIEQALEAATAVVVIWSKSSITSHWVRDEAERGRDRGRLVPVSLDGAMAPLGFRQIQAIDLTSWRGDGNAPAFQNVVRAVMLAAGQTDLPPRQEAVPQSGLSRRTLAVAGVGSLLVAGSGIAAWRSSWFDTAPPENSIAVIPFKNLSGDEKLDYLAEGLSEEVRLQLMRLKELRVMAPTSVRLALEKAGNLSAASLRLGAALALTGSIKISQNRFSVTAELLDSTNGNTMWADRVEGNWADFFTLEDRIASSILIAVSAHASGNPDSAILKRKQKEIATTGGTRNLEALQAYTRAQSFYRQGGSASNYRSALAQFDTAIAADSNFARAFMRRAQTLTLIAGYYDTLQERLHDNQDALEAAETAVRIAPDLGRAYSALGYVLIYARLDFGRARPAFDKALKLSPGDVSVLSDFAYFAAQTGDTRSAQLAVRGYIERDPLNSIAYVVKAMVCIVERNFAGAVEAANKALSLDPLRDTANNQKGIALAQLGKLDLAHDAFKKEPTRLMSLAGMAAIAARKRDFRSSDSLATQMIDEFGDASSYQQAQILAQQGRIADALAMLKKALDLLDAGLTDSGFDPFLDPLRGEAEFSKLLKTIGLV